VLEDDVIRLRDNELCAATTYQSIQKHLFEGHIHFSFLIKKNCKESSTRKENSKPESKEATVQKATTKTHQMPNKGSLKGNNLRKAPSIPIGGDFKPSGGVVKKEIASVELVAVAKHPPDYSSINKIQHNRNFTSPAHCVDATHGAMKRNDDELVVTNLSFTIAFCCCYCSVFIADTAKCFANQ
jgi:hypothetical protein